MRRSTVPPVGKLFETIVEKYIYFLFCLLSDLTHRIYPEIDLIESFLSSRLHMCRHWNAPKQAESAVYCRY